MKVSISCSIILCSLFFKSSPILAQKSTITTDSISVKTPKHTLLGQFEPSLVLSSDKHKALKEQRMADIKRKLSIIDTLDISDRKKRKLIRDLKFSPYSNRLDKAVLVDSKFEEDDN